MSRPGTFYDGSYVKPVRHGAIVPRRDPRTRSMLYQVRYHQLATEYSPARWSTRGPKNSFLVEEGDPRDTDIAGVVEFERTYAAVPSSWEDYEEYHYINQALESISGTTTLIEWGKLTTSKLRYDYFHTLTPDVIRLFTAYRLTSLGGNTFVLGAHSPTLNGWEVAEDSTIRRWMGNIYERVTRYVRPEVIGTL